MADDIIHEIVPVADPSALGLTVEVKQTVLAISPSFSMPRASSNTSQGDAYGSGAFKFLVSSAYLKGFGDYVFVGTTKDRSGWIKFHFVKAKTQDEANVPFRVLTEFKEFYWDPILKAIIFIKDPLPKSQAFITELGIGQASQTTYHTREAYIPGGNLGSLFTIEEYFGSMPFDIPAYEVPIPRAVTYSVPGASGGFPSCIGPKIEIPNLEAGVIAFVAGSASNIGGVVPGQIFPESNVTEWEGRTITDSQKFEMGYYRKRISVVLASDEPDINIK